MKLFPQDSDVVLYETGFEDDILGRKAISKQLSELIERIETPTVFALDDKWGSGKTYFLKRWVAAHKKENSGSAITVYFDAFENDYLSDPLISIISAVSERIPSQQEAILTRWKSAAKKIAKPTLNIALALATCGAKQYLDEIGGALADAVSSEARDAAKDLWGAEKERKDAVISFKALLVNLTEAQNAPIVIVVDELDRCRPDYALSVLEVIKHFFAVPKVHFILGVNSAALENSVKARYGADIDAEKYLRKFINVSFSLPRTVGPEGTQDVIMQYASQLITDMKLPKDLSNRCAELMSYVAVENEVSLRDVGMVFSKIALLPENVSNGYKSDAWSDILCVLLVSSVVNPELHKKFVSASASVDDIRAFIGASQRKTTRNIGEYGNPEYDRYLAIWLVTIIIACGKDKDIGDEDEDLKRLWSSISSNFTYRVGTGSVKDIPEQIQRYCIDVFRV